MTSDQYLYSILTKYTPANTAQARAQAQALYPVIQRWGKQYLQEVIWSGSIAKGTVTSLGSDADIFISLSSSTPDALADIYNSLFSAFTAEGYKAAKQNVSIRVHAGGFKIDFTPGKRQSQSGYDHSIYKNRSRTWTKTNVKTHIAHVTAANCNNEIRLTKIWRSLRSLDLPSFYLELVVIDVLKNLRASSLGDKFWAVLGFLASAFPNARYIDPANTNNVISDDLSQADKQSVQGAAALSRQQNDWGKIVW
jgi:hypothetical protein